jgi:type IV pilus assembly protein PilW
MNFSTRFPVRRSGGFSVVELMVSVVIGMLALMFATRLVATSEASKQASLGGSDSMQNGMLALFSVNNDIAQAGWGLNDPLLTGCDTQFTDASGYVMAPAARGAATVRPMAAAVIEANGAKPDQLSLYAGSAIGGTPGMRVVRNYVAGDATISIDRAPFGFAVGDVIMVAPEAVGARCALSQISSLVTPPAPGQNQLQILASRFSPGQLNVTFTGNGARVFNLGPASSLSMHTWSVQNGFLRLRSTDMAGAATTPATVVDNVVSIKAQYGLDTRSAATFLPNEGMQVKAWSTTMTDADGDGVVGGAGDYQRIAAIRIAVVARSKAPERPAPGAACSATTVAPSVFGTAEPSGVTAVKIDLDVSVANDPVDWKCYRYRVFETIVPLRNSGWRPT